jgi:hypothetical protein
MEGASEVLFCFGIGGLVVLFGIIAYVVIT